VKEPFPLQWPEGWTRTKPEDRQKSRFGQRGQVSFSYARNFLLEELSRLGAVNAVITTDLPVRNDGLPYATGRGVDDVGVAVWFVLANEHGEMQEQVFPCDKWRSHAENMWAIALSIEALRGLDRWGVNQVVTRAFSGFTALPPGSGEEFVAQAPKKRTWREVLGETFAPWPELDADELLLLARTRHRKLIQLHHPDRGGSHDIAAELNVALAEAEAELSAAGGR
jgi:hypothetical protein